MEGSILIFKFLEGGLNVLIDLHCHILPGIDDVPSNFLGFIEMTNTAVSAGISFLRTYLIYENSIFFYQHVL